ncbi:hypothetical protein YB2330_005479 [Saitoella coloradoensis]
MPDQEEMRQSRLPPLSSIVGTGFGSGDEVKFETVPRKADAKMGEFAAQMSAFIWFSSPQTLKAASTYTPGSPIHIPPTSAALECHASFVRWTQSVLNTTQISRAVVLLALYYLYRLKRSSPLVRGKPESEYRLLTVALILGNKYLDDNTYTNKTWSDVAGIPVNEVSVMEIEFISNCRYELFVKADDWREWQCTLKRFQAFREGSLRQLQCQTAASKALLRSPPVTTALSPTSPFTHPTSTWSGMGTSGSGSGKSSAKRTADVFEEDFVMLPPPKKAVTYGSAVDAIFRPIPLNPVQPPVQLQPQPHQLQQQQQQQQQVQDMVFAPRQTTFAPQLPSMTGAEYLLPVPQYQQAQAQPLRTSLPPLPRLRMPVPQAVQLLSLPSAGVSPAGTIASPSYSATLACTPQLSPSGWGTTASGQSTPNTLSPTYGQFVSRSSPYAPMRPMRTLVGPAQPITGDGQDNLNLYYHTLGHAGEVREGVVRGDGGFGGTPGRTGPAWVWQWDYEGCLGQSPNGWYGEQ